MSTIITSVDRHSPAERAGIAAGEQLLTINGHEIIDVLDYRFYGYDTDCRLELREPSGAVRTVSLRKPEGRDLGLNFDTVLMDDMRSCANHCIFCFVDQMPPGMRKTLYFKDDDARLSFLQGNYITLTNLTEREAQRIIDNEQFWKLRHWEQMEKAGEGGNPEDVRPASGWLVNCILSKHADAMDCYPEPTVLPREPGDRQEAETLSRILPVLLKNDRFRRTYSKAWWDKLKSGCAVYGVFWDNEKLHGLGDVSIRSMDVLNLFWEPGVTDIQESEHFFCTELVPNNHLVRRWPELEGKLGRGGAQVSRYLFDDKVDTSEQSLVVDWYYHTEREGRQVLQYCKFVGENVLYATENDPEMAARGWYDHGKYPFVFDTLFPEEGTPCGYGYVDLCKSAQKQIDLMNQAILKNTLAAATPRFFIRADGAVNENEYADWTRPFVHTNGNLGADSIAPIRVPALDSVYVAVLQNKIAEMKETAGNRDVMSGGTAGGVTAATAIAALQEAGGKLSRNMIDDGYEAFSQVVTLCIELIRQFYDVPRQFRLLGRDGGAFVAYGNGGLRPRALLTGGYRVPEFDLEVMAQDETPYQTMEYNQLALQLFQMGFFRSDMAEQALRCLELMQFRSKDTLAEVIRQGQKETDQKAWLTEALRRAVTLLDKSQGTHLAEALERELEKRESSGGKAAVRRSSDAVTRQRQATRQAVRPR